MAQTSPAYVVDALIGAGGAGRVYSATHRPSGRRVALKTLRTLENRSSIFGALMREAAAAAQLCHPNIVALLDAVVHGERPFLVFELVEGTSLKPWVAEFPGWPALARAMDELLDALATAHAAGIVHGDLKPGNLLTSAGGQLKITDFGMAAVFDPLLDASDRARGGTPRYMAPEQLDRHAQLGPWTDQYAVGAILFELLSGRPTLDAKQADWRSQKHGPPPKLVPRPGLEVPDELSRLIERLMSADPAARPRFAADVRRDLAEVWRVLERRGLIPTDRLPSAARSGAIPRDEGRQPTTPKRSSWEESGDPLPSATEVPFEVPAPAFLENSTALLQLRAVPLVARDAERALISATFADAIVSRTPRLLILSGEAGVGKSRLARWALAEVERVGLMVGTAAAYDVSGTTDGLRQLLARLLGPSMPRDSAGLPRSWARWRFVESGVDAARLTEFVFPKGQANQSVATRANLAADAVIQASHIVPVYLWLDDVGWARDGTQEFVERLLERQAARLALIATMRSGTSEHPRVKVWLDRVASHKRTATRTLTRLDAEARAQLVGASAPIDAATCETLAAEFDDTPYAVVQRVYDLIASGALRPGDTGFHLRASPSGTEHMDLATSPQLEEESLARFFRSFGPSALAAEAVLIRCALLGARFTEAELRGTTNSESERRAIPAVIGQGLLHGILRLDPDLENRFEHDVLRVAVLQRLDKRADRVRLLTEVGNGILETRGAQRWEARVAAAQLLAPAGEIDRALELFAGAANDLARLASAAEAYEIMAQARAWVESASTDRRRVRLLLAESVVPYHLRDYDRALALTLDAERCARAVGDPQELAHCRAELADIYFYQGALAASERLARSALEACRVGNPNHASMGCDSAFRLAELSFLRGATDVARELYDLALAYARTDPAEGVGSGGFSQLVVIVELALLDLALAVGALDDAASRFERLREPALDPRHAIWLELYQDAELRYRAALGVAHEERGRIEARLAELESRADRWRLTATHLLSCLAATERAEVSEIERHVQRFLAAFADCPHEKPFTFWALRTLVGRLSDRGATSSSEAVSALLEELVASVARGFSRDAGSSGA